MAMSQEVIQGKETPYIEVVGNGEMEIIPDQIYISFTLKERFEREKENLKLKIREKELKKRLMKLEIDLADLQLADANSDFIKIKRKKNDVIASKDYLLKVSSTGTNWPKYSIYWTRLMRSMPEYSGVDHSDMTRFRKEVKILAIQAAKEKATYLLAGIGETIGKPLFIQERETYDENFNP